MTYNIFLVERISNFKFRQFILSIAQTLSRIKFYLNIENNLNIN